MPRKVINLKNIYHREHRAHREMLKKNHLPLCSAKRLGTLCGEKLFLAVSAFRSSDFISRQICIYHREHRVHREMFKKYQSSSV